MQYVYNLNSASSPEHIRDFPISATAAVRRGQLLGFSSNAASVSAFTYLLGVSAEDHTGTADAFNARSNGDSIRVSCSPQAVYAANAPRITAVSGTAASLITDEASLSSIAETDLSGGYIVLVSKGATSANREAPGTVRKITGYTAASKTFAFASGGAVSAGDVYALFPPIGCAKLTVTSDGQNVALSSVSAQQYFKCVGYDMPNGKLHVKTKSSILA